MKATKFFRLKAEWEKAAQPTPVAPVVAKVEKPVAPPVVVEEPKPVEEEKVAQPVSKTITPVVEEVKSEPKVSAPKATKKKTINVQ